LFAIECISIRFPCAHGGAKAGFVLKWQVNAKIGAKDGTVPSMLYEFTAGGTLIVRRGGQLGSVRGSAAVGPETPEVRRRQMPNAMMRSCFSRQEYALYVGVAPARIESTSPNKNTMAVKVPVTVE
jgi:hypothetical protein